MRPATAGQAVAAEPLRLLMGADHGLGPVRGGQLPAALSDRYGGDLAIPLREGRPTVVANFVSTLDGVVAFDPAAGLGGGAVSGYFEPDRFVMGLLRALADVVMIGAGTARSDSHGRWVAASVHPATATETARVRTELRLAPNPTTVVVTASGDLDPHQRGLSDPDIPVVIVTTERGRARLAGADLAQHVEVVAAGDERIDASVLIETLGDQGAKLVLCEGGPRLLADLIDGAVLDELFLTVSPQIAGRDAANPRIGLVEGHAFEVAGAPWADLVDVRVSGSHLFTRYRFGERGR
jgi:riboflavin biosynthesis pyrimidine reductase